MRVNVFASVCWLCLNCVKHLLTYFRAEHFPFANWEFSSHRFSSPLPERVYFSEQAAIGMAVAKKAAGCWEVAGWGMMCADGNRWWFILETCWATSTLHVPFCRPIAERAAVVRPSLRGTDGPFWRRATAQRSLFMGLHQSSQEQTRSPSVGNIQEIQSVRPNGFRKWHLKLCMHVRSVTVTLIILNDL